MKLIRGRTLAALLKGQGHGVGKWVRVFEAVGAVRIRRPRCEAGKRDGRGVRRGAGDGLRAGQSSGDSSREPSHHIHKGLPAGGTDLLLAQCACAWNADGRLAWADRLTAMACGLRRVDVRRFHLTRPLATVVGPVTLLHATLPMSRRLAPQVLVDLLTHPYCVREARRVVLDALELTYDRPFADLWEFVAFAEVGHPELDLLSPPKRAVVKLP